MSTLRVSYFGGVQHGVAKEPMGAQTLSTSTTSARTNTNPGASVVILFSSTANHWVNTGPAASVEATATNGFFLPQNTERPIAINPGEEIAAITVS